MKKRVLITGMGMIGDFGTGKEDFRSFLSGQRTKKNIHDFNFDNHVDTSLLRRADEISLFASTAAKFALEDAKLLDNRTCKRNRLGIVLGTVHGSLGYTIEYHKALVLDSPSMVSALLFSNSGLNTAVSYISIMFDIRGYTTTLSSYVVVLRSIQCAVELIREGNIDICLVGGVDIYNEILIEGYSRCLKDTTHIADRFGGSGFLVLESLESAKSRGIRGYVEIVGTEILCTSYPKAAKQNTSPIRRLLDKVGLEAKKIDCVLTSSLNERDSRKREEVFLEGIDVKGLSVVNCRKLFGCTFAAAEVFQTILGILGINGVVNLAELSDNLCQKKSFENILINHVSKFDVGCMLIRKVDEIF